MDIRPLIWAHSKYVGLGILVMGPMRFDRSWINHSYLATARNWWLCLLEAGLLMLNRSTVKLQTPLQIFTADKQLIAQFGEKHRDPVINEVH